MGIDEHLPDVIGDKPRLIAQWVDGQLTADVTTEAGEQPPTPDGITDALRAQGWDIRPGWVAVLVAATTEQWDSPQPWLRDAADRGTPHSAYTAGTADVRRERRKARYVIVPDPRRATIAVDDALRALLARDTAEQPPHVAWASTDDHMVCAIGDLQVGKVDHRGGTPDLIERYHDEVRREISYLLRPTVGGSGEPASVTLIDPGDCIEGWLSQGGANRWTTDLEVDAQVQTYAMLLRHRVESARRHYGGPITVAVVGGNHDHTSRTNGRRDTKPGSSWALMAARMLRDHWAPAGVEWVMPEEWTDVLTIEIGGVVHAVTHGDLWRRPDKAAEWWARQADRPAGKATVLVNGHYHHLLVRDMLGGRVQLQVPSIDNGSAWHTEARGDEAPARGLRWTIRHGAVRDLDPVLPPTPPSTS